MSQQLDDLKATQQETGNQLGSLSTSLADVAADVEKLLKLIVAQPEDLSEAIAQATALRDTATALAAAAAAAAGKFDSTV